MKKILLIAFLICMKQINAQCPMSITGNTVVCYGNTTTLTASGATSYTWMPSGVNTSAIVVTPSITTTYSVTGTTGSCTATNTVPVIVHQIPTVTFTVNIDTMNALWTIYPTYSSNVAGATWYFTFQNNQNIPPYSGSYSNDTYYGLYPYGTITPAGSGTVTGIPSTTIYTVCVTVRDSFGCTDTTSFGMPPPPYTYCQYGSLCTTCYYPTNYLWDASQGQTTKVSQISGLNSQILVYPNPANNKITIQANQITEIKLYDLLGNEILNTKEKEIDVSNLNDGIYFIHVNNYTQKVIVQH